MDVRKKVTNDKRLIDGVELRRRIIAFATGMHSEVLPVDTVMMLLMQTPTVDAVEVVHGRWIDKGEYAVCTECGGRSGTQYDGVEPIPLMTQFCPNCGAKMDGGTN